jgi:hypothetical protein
MMPTTWGATVEETSARYPVDDVAPDAACSLFRAITVNAPPERTFRWLCQLKMAPYSYDLVDNGGRRSPRTLTPGVERLRVGDRVQTIFELVSFATDDHLTLRLDSRAGLLAFGQVALTYAVRRQRLIVKLNIGRRGDGLLPAARRHALAWGDLVMMRKQLLTLRDLAEADGRVTSSGAAA